VALNVHLARAASRQIPGTLEELRLYSRMMTRAMVAGIAVAALLAGCSSGPQAEPQRQGTLPGGTAKLSIDDRETADQQNVSCVVTGGVTMIDIGDEQSGSTAVVSNAADLDVESVSIRNLGGFTGSYNRSLGDPAKVSMTGPTYHLSGTAEGFSTVSPSLRRSGDFSIKVSC
jgi:hypothetical protein